MNFLNRLKYYLIGVVLGILMVLAIFKDRKLTSWTPKNQIMKEISSKEMIIPEVLRCSLKCYGFPTDEEIILLLDNSMVEYSESDVSDQKNRKYHFSMKESDIQWINLTIHEEFIAINQVKSDAASCNCK